MIQFVVLLFSLVGIQSWAQTPLRQELEGSGPHRLDWVDSRAAILTTPSNSDLCVYIQATNPQAFALSHFVQKVSVIDALGLEFNRFSRVLVPQRVGKGALMYRLQRNLFVTRVAIELKDPAIESLQGLSRSLTLRGPGVPNQLLVFVDQCVQ